jgi:molybdopterin-guanine dinucleotide biosynthesis protein A
MGADQDGRRQPLLGFYSTAALQRGVKDLASRGALINGSVKALLASLDVQLVTVPAGSTDDVDTWDDAAALGVAGQEP